MEDHCFWPGGGFFKEIGLGVCRCEEALPRGPARQRWLARTPCRCPLPVHPYLMRCIANLPNQAALT
ncbi:uncharacterized protein VTP21DRAFT_4231 [Calcarisporiella thermophila]|uniref:uncharacterized protein n=1 Tax=Calcarisporiella thermophila TaxID=911321 RepID=UPI003742559A